MKLSVLAFIIFISIDALSATVTLEKSFRKTPLGPGIEYLTDPDGRLGIEDVRAKTRKDGTGDPLNWRMSANESLGLGFTRTACWVRFSVANNTGADFTCYLEQNYPLISFIDCYIDDGASLTVYKTGHSYIFSHRPLDYRTFVFPLPIKDGKTITCYLRFRSDSALNIDLALYAPDMFKRKDDRESALLWIFYGMLLVMVMYHLILFFSVKDIGYLYYMLSIAFMLFLAMGLNGMSFQHLWPGNPWWERYNNPVMIGLTTAFFLQFGRYYVDLRKLMPRADIILTLLIVLCFTAGISTLVIRIYRFSILATTAITLASMFYCIYILAILTLVKKSRTARSFLTAVCILIIGVILYIMKTYGFIPGNIITNYSLQAGWVAMVILLSLGLADRLNLMRLQVEEAQRKYIHLLESSNDIIFNLDEKFRFIAVNKAMQKLLGYDPREVLDTGFLDYIDPSVENEVGRHRDIFEEYLAGLGKDNTSITFRSDFKTKYHRDPVTLSVKLDYITSDGKAGIFGTASVVTDDIVLNLMDNERQVYYIDNNFSHAELLCQRLVKNLGKHLDQPGIQSVKTGLLEMIINAIEHGNLDIEFSEKSAALAGRSYLEFVRDRQKDPLYRGKKVIIEYSLSPAMVAYRITDEGKGFDHRSVMAVSLDTINRDLLAHGRGLIIAGKSFDVMAFNDRGNQVTVVKYFHGPTGEEPRF
ncbi:MAG: ATP-binding protein [Spirochaetes bacterium]|nr:ATP-binding protein [Spirochaetota bacterium]